MITLDSNAQDATVAGASGVTWLIEMDFTTGTLYLSTWTVNFTIGGHTYVGLGQFASIEQVTESGDLTTEKLKLGLSVVDQAMLAATIGSVETYRGKRVRLYLQMISDTFIPTGAKVLRWAGFMDKVNVERKKQDPAGGSETGRIVMQCSKAGLARSRNYQGLRLNDAQQQLTYPGDTGYEYIQTLIAKPALWLSVAFMKR